MLVYCLWVNAPLDYSILLPLVLWISLRFASWDYSSLCNTYGTDMMALFFLSVYWQYSACVCYMAGGLLLFIPLLLLLRVDPVVTKKEWSEHFISQAIMIYRWFVKCTSKYIAILKLTALHRNAYFVHLPQESHHNTYKPECQEKECSVQDNLLPPHRRPTRARVRTLSLVHPSLALVSIIIAPPPF